MPAFQKKMKLLVVSLANNSLSGGSRASKSNLNAFLDSGCFDVTVVGPLELDYAHAHFEQQLSTLEKCLAYMALRPTINYRSILETLERIDLKRFDCLFLDNSLLGPIIPNLKKANSNLVILSCFLNIESRALFSTMPKFFPTSYIRYFSIFLAERIAAQKSNIRIAMHSTDSNKMQVSYGQRADFIFPIAFPVPDNGVPVPRLISSDYVLFVGGYYSPNLEAIEFLAKKVAPHVNKKVIVAGFGLERIAKKYAQVKNLSIVIAPEDLGPYYRHAALVVAPIFRGGGIKTKVIEALSYGKTVVCSPEAMIGFESVCKDVILTASDPDDYIRFINSSGGYDFSETAFDYFMQFFSPTASRKVALSLYGLVSAQYCKRDAI